MAMITVLYDSRTRMLLGRKGQWVSPAEFEKCAPETVEDMLPDAEEHRTKDPDPGPTYKCINHVLHVCSGTTCFRLGVPC